MAVLYRVAAMVSDTDPKRDTVRVDHYRHGPYDLLLTPVPSTGQAPSGGRTIGVIRQGPMLPSANLRYRLRSIEHLPRNERPFLTLVLTHADQATRRAIRALGDPSEHRRTFVATEGELLAGDHTGVVWRSAGTAWARTRPRWSRPKPAWRSFCRGRRACWSRLTSPSATTPGPTPTRSTPTTCRPPCRNAPSSWRRRWQCD